MHGGAIVEEALPVTFFTHTVKRDPFNRHLEPLTK